MVDSASGPEGRRLGDRVPRRRRRAASRAAALLAVALALLVAAPAAALAAGRAADPSRRAAELYRAGRYEQALPLYEKVLKDAEAAYDKDRQRLAVALSNVGELNRVLGRLPAAQAQLERAVALADVAEGGTRGLGSSLNNLALLYRDQGRHGEALDRQERALAVFEHSFGRGHPNAAKARENLAALRRLMGEPEDSPRLKRVLVWRSQDAAKSRAPRARAEPARLAAPSRPPTPAAKPSKLRAQAPAPPPRATGRYAVLVSSMRDPAAIPEEWLMLRRQFPVLASLALRPPRAETTANGTVYRLVAGAFPAEAQAETVCAGLRAGGQGCRVVAR